MADISKITIPNGSGTNTYDLKDSEAREGLLSTVKYTEQSLTSEQQAQARENIGAAASADIPTDAVKYTAQTLTDAQKTQARTNIGVVQPDWRQSNSSEKDYIKNKPPIINGTGTGGNLNGGTGMNNMNEATKQNSVAYGYGVSAKGDYSAAFGYFLQALHDYEIAYGKFNQSNADTVFSIGDGTSNSDRHNLMELKTDGTLLLNGNAVKTEGGDDNKLRLGQIEELTGGDSQSVDWKRGFGKITSNNIPSLVFTDSAPSSPPVANVNFHSFGDFIAYNTAEGTRVFPIAGRKSGKPTTGKWIYVESCELMFLSCGAITSLDLSMFDTTGVAIMQSMFSGCTALTALDLSAFDTSSVVNMRYMFNNCTSLKTLDISSFDMTNVVEYIQMFGGSASSAPPLTTLKTPKINPHDDIPLSRTLYSQDGTAYTTLPVTTGTSIELRQSWT